MYEKRGCDPQKGCDLVFIKKRKSHEYDRNGKGGSQGAEGLQIEEGEHHEGYAGALRGKEFVYKEAVGRGYKGIGKGEEHSVIVGEHPEQAADENKEGLLDEIGVGRIVQIAVIKYLGVDRKSVV